MSSTQELISLPRDVLISMLKSLPGSDLLNILSSSSYLKSLTPYLRDEIEEYREDLSYQRGPARKSTEERIKQWNTLSYYLSDLYLLHPKLSHFMDINHMPESNQRSSNKRVYIFRPLYSGI